jgi:enoyl-CoA hydratase/carnithine racemase
MGYETETRVSSNVDDGVCTITICRPESRNALTKSMYRAIREACAQAGADPAVQVIVIEGSHGSFASGGDLKEILDVLESDDPHAILNYEEFLPFDAVRVVPKPTIAKIDGLCIGGGLTLAMMCDIVVASDNSRFAIPEAKVGIIDGHMPRLLREQVPPARLRYWMYTGAIFSAEEAREEGLVTKVVPAEELDAAVAKIANDLKKSSLDAIQGLKRIFNEVRPLSEMTDAYLAMLKPEVLDRLRQFKAR